VNIFDDERNCGGCGQACAMGEMCRFGQCVEDMMNMCNPPLGDCDMDAMTGPNGCETDTSTSTDHCGACGNACATGEMCRFGFCLDPNCTIGTANCDMADPDCETNISNDPANCGACGNACANGEVCRFGQCQGGLICG